jgi:hypothetical protein
MKLGLVRTRKIETNKENVMLTGLTFWAVFKIGFAFAAGASIAVLAVLIVVGIVDAVGIINAVIG